MRTPEEIQAKLEKVLSDERLNYPLANVQTNAPLTLIQVELETTRDILQWVLESESSARIALGGE